MGLEERLTIGVGLARVPVLVPGSSVGLDDEPLRGPAQVGTTRRPAMCSGTLTSGRARPLVRMSSSSTSSSSLRVGAGPLAAIRVSAER